MPGIGSWGAFWLDAWIWAYRGRLCGKRAERITDHAGHKSVAMVRVYTRRSDTFADHAGEGLL